MSKDSDYHPGELIFAIILAGFSAIALWQAFQISGFNGLSEPGVFPMLASGTMLISGLFILRDTLKKNKTTAVSGLFFEDVLPPRLIVMISLVGLYIALMQWQGFIISSSVFLFSAFMYLWRRGLMISVILTIITVASIYFIFRIVFQVVLPKGALF